MILSELRAYLLPIKLAAGAVLCLLLVKGGCAWQAKLDAADMAKAQARIVSLETSLTSHIALYDQMNAKAQQDKATAKEQAGRAADAVKAAQQGAREYQARLSLIQRDLDKAKRDPKCAEQLRATVCAALH